MLGSECVSRNVAWVCCREVKTNKTSVCERVSVHFTPPPPTHTLLPLFPFIITHRLFRVRSSEVMTPGQATGSSAVQWPPRARSQVNYSSGRVRGRKGDEEWVESVTQVKLRRLLLCQCLWRGWGRMTFPGYWEINGDENSLIMISACALVFELLLCICTLYIWLRACFLYH